MKLGHKLFALSIVFGNYAVAARTRVRAERRFDRMDKARFYKFMLKNTNRIISLEKSVTDYVNGLKATIEGQKGSIDALELENAGLKASLADLERRQVESGAGKLGEVEGTIKELKSQITKSGEDVQKYYKQFSASEQQCKASITELKNEVKKIDPEKAHADSDKLHDKMMLLTEIAFGNMEKKTKELDKKIDTEFSTIMELDNIMIKKVNELEKKVVGNSVSVDSLKSAFDTVRKLKSTIDYDYVNDSADKNVKDPWEMDY